MNILKEYNIKAKKFLWQNFLIDEEKLKIISETLDLENKNIVEIWPWYWALTEKLLEKNPKKLEIVELDREMIEILDIRIREKDLNIWNTSFTIKNIDVLKYKPEFENYFVIANIPYYITSPILRHFFYNIEKSPEKMLLLMQKDVWDKILSWIENNNLVNKKKKIKNSVLSLFLQKKSYIKEILFVWKECFNPSPKVDSSVLLFEKHNLYNDIDDGDFLEFIKLSFIEPRKKLMKNLAKKYKKDDILKIFEKYNLWENVRAEELNIRLYCELIWDFNKLLT